MGEEAEKTHKPMQTPYRNAPGDSNPEPYRCEGTALINVVRPHLKLLSHGYI